jgi:hypothetical protein
MWIRRYLRKSISDELVKGQKLVVLYDSSPFPVSFQRTGSEIDYVEENQGMRGEGEKRRTS